MNELTKDWFELKDHQRRLFGRVVWIPVYGSDYPIKRGKYPEIGYIEEVLAVGSAVIFTDKRANAEKLDWHYWSINDTRPNLGDDGHYSEAGLFHDSADGPLGFRLVLSQ